MPVTLQNIAFQALSFIVLGLYCRVICLYRAQAAGCLKSVVTFSKGEWIGAENKRMYEGFLNAAILPGALSLGLAAVKVAAMARAAGALPGELPDEWLAWGAFGPAGWLDSNGALGATGWLAPAAAVAVALLAWAVVAVQMWILDSAGRLTLSRDFTAAVVQTKRNSLAAISLLVTPVVAVWTGVNPARDMVAGYLFVGVTVTAAALFVAHTLGGFMKQKVSLLVWFLYLCTVEIFPIGAVVLVAARNF